MSFISKFGYTIARSDKPAMKGVKAKDLYVFPHGRQQSPGVDTTKAV
jgi:hypothetical protein